MRNNRHKRRSGRREFIRRSALIAVSASLPVLVACRRDEDLVTPGNKQCETTVDILGPFYKADAPFRERIIPVDNLTEPLIVHGKVLSDCDAVIQDAVVEIWNADENGVYDMSADFNFRGRFQTGADGFYRFQTIVPGRYLNGSTFRPSHIHFLIGAQGYQDLISQIYFKDDPFIKSDPWAGAAQAVERILMITQDADGVDTVKFDIYLNS